MIVEILRHEEATLIDPWVHEERDERVSVRAGHLRLVFTDPHELDSFLSCGRNAWHDWTRDRCETGCDCPTCVEAAARRQAGV